MYIYIKIYFKVILHYKSESYVTYFFTKKFIKKRDLNYITYKGKRNMHAHVFFKTNSTLVCELI